MIDLEKLNEEQKEAVLDTENNLLILACAGSGKTLTITYKIAYEIESSFVYPSQICAVTFTNRAAKEMRERIDSLLPDTDTNGMVVRTFHSLCASLLRRFGERVGLARDFTIYDDEDSFQVLLSVCSKERKIVREMAKTISKVKDLGLSPDDPKTADYSPYPDFRVVYRSYEKALRATGNVDFADLIGKCVELLSSDEEARSYCHRRFRLVLVDEYQDSNSQQFEFLRLFVSPSTRLIAVGDDDQSIYSFRGAEIRNILSFASDFKGVREIKLEKNYRSTDEILAPAGALIRHNRQRHDKNIVSADGKKGQKPVVLVSPNGNLEAKRVVGIIHAYGNYDGTAILYRTNAQSLPFETELLSSGIPYKVVGSLKFYDREEIKDSLAFLRLLLNHRDTVSFRRIINKPSRKLGEKKVESILSYSEDLLEALESFSAGNPSSSGEGAREFLRAWKNAERRLDEGETLGDMMNAALDETGLRELYESEPDRAVRETRTQNLSQLVSVLSQTERENDAVLEGMAAQDAGGGREALSQFLERLTLDTTVLGNDDPRDRGGVTLITMHNTKGLEYDTVFCVGLENELIPGRNTIEEKEIEEERRILYVAMTRARKRLYLSYAMTRMIWGHTEMMHPTCFLRDIPSSLLEGDSEPSWRRSPAPARPQTQFTNTPSWARNIGADNFSVRKAEPKIKTDERQLELVKGDRVRSRDKGEGTVSDVLSTEEKTIITVQYDSGRKMRYVAGHADIEKIC